jgi:hypothetical protein
MKTIFYLVTRHGIAGEFHYDWQFPVIPRIGENIHIGDIFDEGKFIVVNDDHIESKVNDIPEFVKELTWEVTGITWYKNDGSHHIAIMMKGE